MRPGFIFFAAMGFMLMMACKKDSNSCKYLSAGAGLEFRIVDTSGKDYLYPQVDTMIITQPCLSGLLMYKFKDYRVPGGADSGTIITFSNLRTPEHGEGGECFRLYFNWINDDEDTVDWHYRMEHVNGCNMQVIDYLSFNGIQALKKTDYAHEYYQLVKR